MILPKYIGHPGKQTRGAYGEASKDFSADYDNFVDQKLVIATLKPGKPKITADANIYNFEDKWATDYKKDLEKLNIFPEGGDEHLNVVISQLSPITRSFQNRYGDSTVLPQGNILGEAASDLLNITGGNTEELQKLLQSENGGMIRNTAANLVGAYNTLVDKGVELGNETLKDLGINSGIFNTIGNLAKSPQSKIGWPKMWRDCSFQQSYQLNTRLYCFSTNDMNDYNNNIKACIAALELFVTPKSDDGVLYTQPYILEFDIPGMIHFPCAYVEDMQVIEGGSDGDFAQTGRPNVVDITMTIQNVYSISTNTPPEKDREGRPSVRKDLIGLASGRNLGIQSTYRNGGGESTKGQNKSYKDAEKEQSDSENPEYDTNNNPKARRNRTLSDAQQEVKNAFNNLSNESNNSEENEIESES